MHREDGVNDVPPAAIEASINLIVYYQEMVAERRKKPTDDLTSALLEAEIDGDRLTDEEVLGFLFLMVIAGNETTTKLLANAAFWGHKNPDQLAPVYARPRPDPAVGRGDAALRHVQPDPGPRRRRRADAVRHHHSRRRHAAAAARLGAPRRAGVRRTPTTTSSAARSARSCMSFGSGAHFCLGAHLARMEARVALAELFKRIRGYEVDEANAVRVHSSNVRGFAHLPMHRGGPRRCRASNPFPTAGPPSSRAPRPASARPPPSSSPPTASRSRSAPAVSRSSTSSSARSRPTAARPSASTSTSPTPTR